MDRRARVGRQAQAQAAGADQRQEQTGCGHERRGSTALGLWQAATPQLSIARLWLANIMYAQDDYVQSKKADV